MKAGQVPLNPNCLPRFYLDTAQLSPLIKGYRGILVGNFNLDPS